MPLRVYQGVKCRAAYVGGPFIDAADDNMGTLAKTRLGSFSLWLYMLVRARSCLEATHAVLSFP